MVLTTAEKEHGEALIYCALNAARMHTIADYRGGAFSFGDLENNSEGIYTFRTCPPSVLPVGANAMHRFHSLGSECAWVIWVREDLPLPIRRYWLAWELALTMVEDPEAIPHVETPAPSTDLLQAGLRCFDFDLLLPIWALMPTRERLADAAANFPTEYARTGSGGGTSEQIRKNFDTRAAHFKVPVEMIRRRLSRYVSLGAWIFQDMEIAPHFVE